jgi:hypothetical protein
MSGGISLALPRHESENAPGENIKGALREIDQLRQRWDQGLSVKNLALAERYLKGELEFGFVFVARSPVGDVTAEFVAIFERKLPAVGLAPLHRGRTEAVKSWPVNVELYSKHLMGRGYRDEDLVFVGDVETVEFPELVVPISTVRLQRAHEFYRLCGRASDSSDGAAVEMGLIRTYWEGCVVARRSAAVLDKLDGEQIQGRTQIMNAIAQDRAPLSGDGDIEPEAVNFVTRVRFFIGHDAIRMERVKGIDGRFEVRKMFFGPVDFYSAPIRGLVMTKSDPTKAPEFQRVLGNLLKKPPKPHSEMKIGKRPKAKPAHKKSKPQNG